MVNIEMFRHPKYYKELRKRALDERNKSDQAISKDASTEATSVRPGPGPKLTRRERGIYKSTALTPGVKHQASSAKLKDPQATSDKHQAPRHKRQA